GDRRRAARGRRRRRARRPERPADRRVPLLRPGRAVGQHDGLRRADHAQAVGGRRLDAGREVPASEPREGAAGAARAPVRAGARGAAGRARRRPALAGRHGRPGGEDPHLQLRRASRHRPPHQADRPQPRPGARRRAGRADGRAPGRREAPPPGGAGRGVTRTPQGTPAADALQGAITAISAAGCETPRLDAEVLLASVLGVGRERLITDRELTVAGPAVRAYQDAVRRRAVLREPVAYITGRRAFRHLELKADRRALVPRPETELLVECGLRLPAGAAVLDLCTGSGAVALALKAERPDLRLTGSDISEPALELARENARELGLDVSWVVADLLEGLPDEFDAVLVNPPYVAESER